MSVQGSVAQIASPMPREGNACHRGLSSRRPGWTPGLHQTTRMMPYVEAYALDTGHPLPQPWLDSAMVHIPGRRTNVAATS
jgi:hypothetical protein